MNITTYVERVDDYSGELARNLATLERAHLNGAVDRIEQLGFVAEVQRAVLLRDLRPWRTRSIWATCTGLGLLVLSGNMACLLPNAILWSRAISLLAALGLGLGGGCCMVYFRRRKNAHAWFRNLEDSIRGGASLFDLG